MVVNVSPLAEKQLAELATRTGQPLPDLAGSLLEEKLRETDPLAFINGEEAEDPDALAKAIAKLTSRTPEEIEETRARIFASMEPPRPLPEGKTLFDVLEGQWPGDETDEQVYEALRKLS